MKLSVALAVHNEADIIENCLSAILDIADEIVLVDGKSTDNTVEIAQKIAGSKLEVFSYENPSMFHINKQKALEHCRGDWILQLDADELVTDALKKEIKSIIEAPEQTELPVAYWMPRLNFFLGRPLTKGGQYPDPTIRLYKNGVAHFPCKTVHEQVEIKGTIGWLKNDLHHYPYPTFRSFIDKWTRYGLLEGEINTSINTKSVWTFLNYFVLKPKLWFLKAYFRHRGYVDGFPGFIFALFSALRFWLEYIHAYEIARHSSQR